MILTNYPFDRALVAERRRDPLDHAEPMRRTSRERWPTQTRLSTTRSSFASWLRALSARHRRPRSGSDPSGGR
jgi:hypothetical protein